MVKWLKNLFHKEREIQHFVPAQNLTAEERASHANRLLMNPIFQEVMGRLIDDAVTIWKRTSFKDTEEREFLWGHIRALEQLQGRIERMVNDSLYELKQQQDRQAQAAD